MSHGSHEETSLHMVEYARENEVIGLILFGFITALIETPIQALIGGDTAPTFTKRESNHHSH